MNFAIKQRYVPASLRFEAFPALQVNRREEFTPEEYRSSTARPRVGEGEDREGRER